MIKINVNGKEYEVEPKKTVLETLRKLGFEIPTLCNFEGIHAPGACRMCVVEVEGARNLQASCIAPIRDGMIINTQSNRVLNSRKKNIQLLMADHPDCLTCSRNKHCDLQNLAEEYGVIERIYKPRRNFKIDNSAPAYFRDNNKCILCERCVAVCDKLVGVHALDFINRGHDAKIGNAFDDKIIDSICVECGQCVINCPTGALSEKSDIEKVFNEINNSEKLVVVQTAPSIRTSIGEEFNLNHGVITTGKMVAALKRLGFDKVLDTTYGADMTIMEEGHELLHRLTKMLKGEKVVLPQFTSCCPAWVKHVEHKYPMLLNNLSTAKSPHQHLGTVIKHYYSTIWNILKEKIIVVSVMPCTAKKFEIKRDQLKVDGIFDVDYVLTTREFAKMIKQAGISFKNLPEEKFDQMGTGTGGGEMFGVTGGVMEAALRTAYEVFTGKRLEKLEFDQIRGLDSIKEGSIIMNETEIKFAVVSGLAHVKELMEDVKKGISPYHFIEVMVCPGGCINGGGQPFILGTRQDKLEVVKKRMQVLYDSDKINSIRRCHENPLIINLYKNFLGKPLSEKSHKYMHTSFQKRS